MRNVSRSHHALVEAIRQLLACRAQHGTACHSILKAHMYVTFMTVFDLALAVDCRICILLE